MPKNPTYWTRNRPVPMCRSPEMGYAVPAHKLVFSHAFGLPFREVPKLRRCHNDRCVSPEHTHPMDPMPVPTLPSFMERLQEVRPAPDMGPNVAADECELPPIPADIWAAYCAWDQTNPDANDE